MIYLDNKKGGFLQMIKIPSIFLALYGVFVGTSCLGFLDATLEPHLRQVQLDDVVFNYKILSYFNYNLV